PGFGLHQSGAGARQVLGTETVSRRQLVILAAWLAAAGACRGKPQRGAASSAVAVVQRSAPPPTAQAAARAAARTSAPASAGPAVRSEHAVFELVDNRHAAHRYANGELVLDASDIGFARYTRFSMPAPRWRLGREVDGERAAIADRFAALE